MTDAEMLMVAALRLLGMSEASARRLAEQMAEAVRDACAAGLRVTCETIVRIGDEHGPKAALALARYLLATCESEDQDQDRNDQQEREEAASDVHGSEVPAKQACETCGGMTDPDFWDNSGGLCGDCLAEHGFMVVVRPSN